MKQEGYEINNESAKTIKTRQYTDCSADYYGYIHDNGDVDNIYMDLHIPKDIYEAFKDYCKSLEIGYGGTITLAEQLPVNSNVIGINVIEL